MAVFSIRVRANRFLQSALSFLPNVVRNNRDLGAAPIVAVVAEKYDGQRIFVAAYPAALRHATVMTPWLVELSATHLAGGLLNTIQGITADNAGFLFTFGCFRIIWNASLFCHRYPATARESIPSLDNLTN